MSYCCYCDEPSCSAFHAAKGDADPSPSAAKIIHIVDDDDGDRAATSTIFVMRGFHTHVWKSPSEFLAGIDEVEAGAVIVDPGRDMPASMFQRRVATAAAPLPVIIVTRHASIPAATAAMRAGALDYLEKPVAEAVLATAAIHALGVLHQWRMQAAAVTEARAKLARLSPRERDVLDHLVAGASNKLIAAKLAISVRTVEIHRARVMTKLGATSLVQIAKTVIAAQPPPELER